MMKNRMRPYLAAMSLVLVAQAGQASEIVGQVFRQAAAGAVSRVPAEKMRDVVSFKDFGAKGDGVTSDSTAINAALSSGAKYVVGGGLSYRINAALLVQAGVTLDCQGGELVTAGSTVQDVVDTAGAGVTVQNCTIRAVTPGTRSARYGVLVSHKGAKLRNLRFKDITYSAVFNDGDGTIGTDLYAENSGWDLVSNYANAKNGYFSGLVAVRNGRSAFSTDVGARDITLDGFTAIDNGLDEITTEHKDVIHFEGAINMTVKNGTILYTGAYNQGKISQTWAILRWNASTNSVIQNVDIKTSSSANGKLILAQMDGANTGGKAININVNSEDISSHPLQVVSYDGAGRFRWIGGVWRGYVGINVATAGGNAFESVSDIDAAGPGSGTFLTSQYITEDWSIQRVKLRGYNTAFNLNGFRGSSIRDCEIEGAQYAVFTLLNSNAGASYQPDGGAIVNNVMRGPTGVVLQTNNQQARSLVFAGNVVDGSASKGLDTTGGTANASTASIKAMGNSVGGALSTTQTGTNGPGALNANMNNLTQ